MRLMAALRWPIALLVGYTVLVAPSLGQTLLESHAYRQTQTAYTAQLFARDGIDLFHPPLPVLGPPGSVPLEFPLFQAFGALLLSTGTPTDLGMRIAGLATFLLSAVLLYAIARHLLGGTGSLIALGAYLFNPHAILYGRASLIEYLAVAGGLMFVLFALRWMDSGRAWEWLVALIGASCLLLVKVTTGPIFLAPALLWRSPSGRWGFQRPPLWVLLGVAVGLGFAWARYASLVRLESPATAFLAMEASVAWFFGSIPQRLDPGEWRVPLVALLSLTGAGVAVWAVLAFRRAGEHPQRWFMLAQLGMIVLPVVILFNLYAEHDYYYAAVAPWVALAVGAGAEYLLRSRRTRTRNRLIVGLAGAWAATLIGMAGTWTLIYGTPRDEPQLMAAADFIRLNSDPDDWVAVQGTGWNSAFLYYAGRRGFADPTGDNLLQPGDIDVDRILSDPVYGPFFHCDAVGRCTVSETR
jgi:hypothetical protein